MTVVIPVLFLKAMNKKIVSYGEENASLMSKKVRKQWSWGASFNVLSLAVCVPMLLQGVSAVL